MILTLGAVSLFVRLLAYTGLVASDDLVYSYFAEQIADGTYRLVPHHFAIRYGVLLPLAALYRLFGVHEWTTVILPLAASVLAPPLAALLALRISGPGAAWIVGLLLACFPVEVRYASLLVPEPIMETVLLFVALLYLIAVERRSPLLAFLAGVGFGCAYLVKETAAFVVMGFCLFAVLRKEWRVAGPLALGAALVAAAEIGWYWSQVGDPLFRSQALEFHNRTSGAVEANRYLSYRLWKAYPRMMLVPNLDFGLHSLVALTLGAIAVLRDRSARVLWLSLWAALPFLFLNFGSTRISTYWVMPVSPRYISFVYVPLFLLAGPLLSAWTKRGRWKQGLVTLLVSGTCAAGLWCGFATRNTGYHTAEVDRLRQLIAEARSSGQQLCTFRDPRPQAMAGSRWRRTVRILGPDVLGCGGDPSRVVPDSRGLPTLVL